jgi:hypothetical protein
MQGRSEFRLQGRENVVEVSEVVLAHGCGGHSFVSPWYTLTPSVNNHYFQFLPAETICEPMMYVPFSVAKFIPKHLLNVF